MVRTLPLCSWQLSRYDFFPRIDFLHAAQEMAELPHFVGTGLEQIERSHRGEIAQYLQPIIDKMRDTQLFADIGLFMSFAAEMDAFPRDAGLLVKLVVVEPL